MRRWHWVVCVTAGLLACAGPDGGEQTEECAAGESYDPITGACRAAQGGDDAGGVVDSGAGGGAEDAGSGEEDAGSGGDPVDMGAGVDPVDMGADGPVDMGSGGGGELYVSSASPWGAGALGVTSSTVGQGQDGAPVEATVWAPTQPGTYATLVFQHGFLLDTAYYSQMLERIASHGFVVVAPQMYAPGGLPFGKPSSAEEATSATQVWSWVVTAALPTPAGVVADTTALAVAGHSRGAKVSWLVLNAGDGPSVGALVGVDPVDGTGGPGGNEPRAISGTSPFAIPTLIVGAELGPEIKEIPFNPFPQACAPAGDNYVEFYGASPSPARLALVEEQGHMDVLDDSTSSCGTACTACVDGAARQPMRETAAGLVVLHLREALLGDASAAALFAPGGAPATYTTESR